MTSECKFAKVIDMPNLHIDVAEHGTAITVSEMRKLLARTLSKLKGENKVTFSFHCQVELPKGESRGHDDN